MARRKKKDIDQPELSPDVTDATISAAGAGDQEKPADESKPELKPGKTVGEAVVEILKGEAGLKETVLTSLKSFYKGVIKSQELDTFLEDQATLFTRLTWKAKTEKDERKAAIFESNLKEIIAQGKGKAQTLRVAIEVKLKASEALKTVGEFLLGLLKAKLL